MKEYKEGREKEIDGLLYLDRDGTVLKSMSEYSESFLVDVAVVSIPQNFSHQPP